MSFNQQLDVSLLILVYVNFAHLSRLVINLTDGDCVWVRDGSSTNPREDKLLVYVVSEIWLLVARSSYLVRPQERSDASIVTM